METKKILGMISKHFMFSYHKFFSVKVFHDDPRGSKHAKFKSKKQNFTHFKFLKFEAIIDFNKDLHKRKKQSNQKWTRYGNWKIFSSRLINFVALWWPKKSFVGIFVCGSSISAKNRSIWYTNLKNNFFFLKSWSSVAGLSPTQIEISNKKSYTLTNVFYGCSKKANQLI